MASEIIKMTVEASGGPAAKVIVDDFLKQSAALMGALKETAKILDGDKAESVRYRFDELSTNSPLMASYRGEVLNFSGAVNFPRIHETLEIGIEAILNEKEIPRTVNAPVLKYLREFCGPIGNTVHVNRIAVNGHSVVLDSRFKANLANISTQDKVHRGMEIKGKIEAANIHAKSRTFFFLYPTRGDKVRCLFSEDLRDQVVDCFGRFVRIHGDFKYAWRENHPYEVKVREIENLPDRSELPDIRKLFGAAPNATGELTAEEFIENMRYG
ncbi:MAG: hypothetical protein U1F65_07635 [Verrucomicrobiota bacterium]